MAGSYSDIGEFEAAIAAALRRTLPPDVAEALAKGVRSGEAAYRTVPPRVGGTALNLKVSRFVIRDDDLPFWEAIGAIAGAVAGVAAGGPAAWSAAIPGLTSFAALVWNLRRKGAVISEDQQRILALLREHGPCSVETLALRMSETFKKPTEKVPLEKELRELGIVETRDGTLIALVSRTEEGLWRAQNV